MTEFDRSAARGLVVETLRNIGRIGAPDGVEELVEIVVGGVRQWLSIRGKDAGNPVLLFIHGGPGSPEMPASWLYQRAWEDHFVVVQWDQRGCGKSAAAAWPDLAAGGALTERMVADAREVVAHLRTRFGCEKVVAVGHSWGTIVGTALARSCPDWLHAYVGVGQVIDWVRNEQASYAFVVQQARKAGLAEALSELEALAPYPGTAPLDATLVRLLTERKWVVHFGGMMHGHASLDDLEQAKQLSPEYSADDLDMAGQVEDAVQRLLPELIRYDCSGLDRLRCPVLIAAGRHDFATPSSVALQWFERLEAPSKHWTWFERSAHMPHIEEPGRFLGLLVDAVLPLTSRGAA